VEGKEKRKIKKERRSFPLPDCEKGKKKEMKWKERVSLTTNSFFL